MTQPIVCADCGQEKPHFAKGMCKQCYGRHYMRGWNQQNPDRARANARKSYRRHREKRLAYVEAHKQERTTYMRQWRKAHKEERAAYMHQWNRENPERFKARQARCHAYRQARIQGTPNTLMPEELDRLLIIGKATHFGEKLALDHFIPITRGGGTTFANTHYIPADLNAIKHNKLPQDIYKQLEFL